MSFSKAYLRVLSLGNGQVVMFLLQRASKKYCSCQKAFKRRVCAQWSEDCFWQATQENLTCLLGQGQRMLNHWFIDVKTGLKLISMVLYWTATKKILFLRHYGTLELLKKNKLEGKSEWSKKAHTTVDPPATMDATKTPASGILQYVVVLLLFFFFFFAIDEVRTCNLGVVI